MTAGRNRHPDKDIEAAVRYAEEHGWFCVPGKGHAWGILRCPWNDRECRCNEFCSKSVWSTPRDGSAHAQQIRRIIDRCIHVMKPRDEKE